MQKRRRSASDGTPPHRAATGRAEGRFTKTVPELGAILPEGPVTVGGKRIGGADDQTDQFRGDLDDIWFHTD